MLSFVTRVTASRSRHWLFVLAVLPLTYQWLAGEGSEPLLTRESVMHFVFAAVSAVAFLWVIPVLFGRSSHDSHERLGYFLFTGVVGMMLLRGIHLLAVRSRDYGFEGDWGGSFFWHLIRLVDMSNAAADNARAPFLLRFAGFTFGVGMPEEFVKIVVVWYLLDRAPLGRWKDALVVGLLSGVAFGVAEGIVYAERYYNGMSSGAAYVTRFIACVGLHAAWTGSAAILMSWKRDKIFRDGQFLVTLVMILVYLCPLMLIHGLYDTLVLTDRLGGGVFVAFLSFAGLAFMVERGEVAEQQRESRERLGSIRTKIVRGGMDCLSEDEFRVLRQARRGSRSPKTPQP